MTPTRIRADVVTERVAWIRQMIAAINNLPLTSLASFLDDDRNAGAAESYLRRGIEVLLDLGRHILAKGFALAVTEYKQIGSELVRQGILDGQEGELMRKIAGYRNRMVHFYSEGGSAELYELCTRHAPDLTRLSDAMVRWLRQNPKRLDRNI